MNKEFIFLLTVLSLNSMVAQTGKSLRLLKDGEFEQAIELTRKRQNQEKSPIRYHHFLARAHMLLGDYIEAEEEFKIALALVDQKETQRKLVLQDFDVMDELSLLYIQNGNWEQARSLINRSLKSRIRKWRKNDPANYRPYLPLGLYFYEKGDLDSAKFYLKSYARSLRNSNYTNYLDVDEYADVYQLIADIAVAEDNPQEAIRLANKSLRLQRHLWTRREVGKNYPDQIRALNTLTEAALLDKKNSKARKYNRRAIRLFEKHCHRQELLQAKVYLNQAGVEFAFGNDSTVSIILLRVMDLQYQFVETTFSFLSEYEKENVYKNFNATNARIIQLASSTLRRQGTLENPLASDLLNFIINTKALILNESNKLVALASDEKSPLHQKLTEWKDLKNQWSFLNTASKRANREALLELQNEIVELEKQLFHELAVAKRIHWEDVIGNLSENELAMELTRIKGEESSAEFLSLSISKESKNPDWRFIDLKMSPKQFLNYYRNSIHFGIADTVSNILLEHFPETVRKIYLSPSSILHQVNFNTLKDTRNELIVDRHEIINLSNIGSLVKKTNDQSELSRAVLVGMSDFSSIHNKSYENLIGVEKEISSLSELFEGHSIDQEVYLNELNSKQLLQSSKGFDILHIATHGYYDSSNPNPMLGSGLILTSSDSLNHRITAFEASLLQLEDTDLVVLSACGTGLGNVDDGDGVYGLQRAFEVAGVNNIIISLWEIDDEFTNYFMSKFYSNLFISGDIPVAFNTTLNEARAENSNPKYWGVFKLVQFY